MLLISSSKDSEVKVFDTKNNYNAVQIVDDHKAAVIGVHCLVEEDRLHLVTLDCKSNIMLR